MPRCDLSTAEKRKKTKLELDKIIKPLSLVIKII